MKVVALAGGVGGAKLAEGLAQALPPADLTVIVNTGDDFEHLGLHISPDLDTVCYTLAGLANAEAGWGRSDETWNSLEEVSKLGGPGWFRLGDRDLGTHLERTRRIREGRPLSEIVRDFCRAWGVAPLVLPMTDDPAQTIVETKEGALAFQDYFVRRGCKPEVTGFRLDAGDSARPAPGVATALADSDRIVICPSNPWVSIAPILSIPGIRSAVDPRKTVAVSPIIGGRALKGPAAKMYAEMGLVPSATTVARHYLDVATHFVLDSSDAALEPEIRQLGMHVLVTSTIMGSPQDRLRLARSVLDFVGFHPL